MAHRPHDVITSAANPVIKRIRSLQRRKYRLQERAYVVEGVRAVNDVIAAGVRPETIILREDAMYPVTHAVESAVRRVSSDVFDGLTEVAHPQGVLAVVPMPIEAALPDLSASPLVVYLDGVRDPGNMGTLFRSAAGAGVTHLIVGPECVDPYHPKSVRAGMGAHLRLMFSHAAAGEVDDYIRAFPLVALADAAGSSQYDQVNWREACVQIIGGEAFGPSSRSHNLATLTVSIPLGGGVESLNAGVAGSLLMFEAARQRRTTLIAE